MRVLDSEAITLLSLYLSSSSPVVRAENYASLISVQFRHAWISKNNKE